jgi:signal-transduction protein with cAMP-binding, CBS, and nucleotidyltransferase domain
MLETTHTNPALERLLVVDAMHAGLISCRPEDPIRTVARLMATYRVHAVLVTSHGEDAEGGWGVVSDTALLRAAEKGTVDEVTAGSVAETPVLTVATSDEFGEVAHLMVERDVSHVVAVESHSQQPLGVLSTLDIARALAGFPERHPGGH